MSTATRPAQPRKSPVQARSLATVDAIHEAAIQVLVSEGLSRCTTTRVAERAGVSVGSLYQYYPNRTSLLAAVLAAHLEHVAAAVEAACLAQRGKPVADMARAVALDFLEAKLSRPDASKALYKVAEEHGGADIVDSIRHRMVSAVATMLASAPDARFQDVVLVSRMLLSALTGPVRSVLEDDVPPDFEAALREQLVFLAQSYLARVAQLGR